MHVRALAGQLARAGHRVDVITTAAGCGGGPESVEAHDGRSAADGVRVRRLDLACFPHFQIAVAPRTVRAVAAAVADGGYDLVHAHASVVSPLAFAGAAAASRLGIPAVLTHHSVLGRAVGLLAAADRVTNWTRWRALHTAVSPLVADEVREAAARAGAGQALDVHVLPNGIHPEAWAVARRPRRTTDGAASGQDADAREFRVASVMRLAARKRPGALVEIADRVRAALPAGVRLRLRVAGDGPERARFEREVARRKLADVVELLGWRPPEQIRTLYAESDAFVLPSILESFGIAALEARCAGLPVVAMRRAGPAAFVRHGVEGLLADDDAHMAAQLLRLATDDRLHADIALHNRATLPAETWPAVLARHVALYADARRGARRLALRAAAATPVVGGDDRGLGGVAAGRLVTSSRRR
jgi:glycosyltransferase involved in cell wall biosynthesis